MRFVNRFPLLLSACLAMTSATGWALPSDRDQPIRIQADSAELDDRQGVAMYRGNVVITQGTLKITGDTVTITQNNAGDVDIFTAVGNRAYYEQVAQQGKEPVQAYGRTIQYFTQNERIVLLDQARVINEGNTFESEKIVYDTRRQIINAGRAGNSNVSTQQPRIDMTIQPRSKSGNQQAE